MDTFEAIGRRNAAIASGAKMMAFDWHKAVAILRERGLPDADAGLQGDLDWTGGPIFSGGKPVPAEDTYTYLASIHAEPVLVIDGEEIPCWGYDGELPGKFDEKTYWPPCALALLAAPQN